MHSKFKITQKYKLFYNIVLWSLTKNLCCGANIRGIRTGKKKNKAFYIPGLIELRPGKNIIYSD